MRKTQQQLDNQCKDFIKYFKRLQPVNEDVIYYLLQHNFVSEKILNAFCVNSLYIDLKNDYEKKEALVLYITNRYGLTRQYIFSLLKNDNARFLKNKYFLKSLLTMQ